jgi:hypothetical protein
MATEFAAPALNSIVEVVTDWSDDLIARDRGTARKVSTGMVVRNAPFDEKGTFCLRTDRLTVSIPLARVVALRYLDRDVAAQTFQVTRAPKPVDEPEQVFSVTGSKGDPYIVTKKRGQWFCTCSGFGFRGKCRHVETAKELAKTNA